MFAERVVLYLLVAALITCENSSAQTNNAILKLVPLRPQGFRVYIQVSGEKDFRNVFFLGFLFANINVSIFDEHKILGGVATRLTNGRWLYEDRHTSLAVGMVMRCNVFMPGDFTITYKPKIFDQDQVDFTYSERLAAIEANYNKFIITALVDPSAPDPFCAETVTKVRGRRVCAGEVIFEDNFDTLQEELWQIEQYIPDDHPEHPFVSYQRLTGDENVYVKNGNLYIVAKLQEDLFKENNNTILTGSLDLKNGCTRRTCAKVAFGSDILPPVVSGRLTSALAFKYGEIVVRAKLPLGDWLYPEVVLEPFFNKLVDRSDVYRLLKVVKERRIIDKGCKIVDSIDTNEARRDAWATSFHKFSLVWTPDKIEFSVDDILRVQYLLTGNKTIYDCLKDVRPEFRPFDDYHHIALGVAAGGVAEFSEDETTEDGSRKPWHNGDHKASLKFWQGRRTWQPTWTRPSLVVDYVKVIAI